MKPFVLFTGGVKTFNLTTLRFVARSILRCQVIEKLILTGQTGSLEAAGEPNDRIESRLCSPSEISLLQRQASVLLVATDVNNTSQTSLGYLPGRLPEYVSTRRPILLIGPHGSDAARAVRHWHLGPTTTSTDEAELARLFDELAVQATKPLPDGGKSHDLFLEVFSREEARRRLFGEASSPISSAAAALAAEFELPLLRS